MKAPEFWYRDRSLRAALLSPIGAVYAALTARRVRQPADHRAGVPVICIGNINAGGTGKTPTTIALAQRLLEWGHKPHIVSRGFGGTLAGPVRVDPDCHDAGHVGDEPLMLSAFAPVWVSKARPDGVKAAERAGASVILLDDGHQNPAVHKDLSVVVVDAVSGFGNGKAIPAGPLRESVPAGLARADVLLAIGPPRARAAFRPQCPPDCTRINGQLDPLETGMPWAQLRVMAFAGIGHPEKFFATLRSLGAEVVREHAMEDHQPFTDALLSRLGAEAKAGGLILVTTEKDAARLPADFRPKVHVLPVRLTIEDWAPLDRKLASLGITS